MNPLTTLLNNPTVSVIGISIALILALVVERGCHGDARYEQGRVDERSAILSLPPDTVVVPGPPISFTPQLDSAIGKIRRRTAQEQAVFQQSILTLAAQNDSLNSLTDRLKQILDEKLIPYTANSAGATEGISGSDTVTIHYLWTVDTDPNTRWTQLVLELLPFSFPQKTVTHYVPVPEESEWYEPYHWVAIGAALYIVIVTLIQSL